MHPFKRDQPSLCLSCHACQPQKCVPLHGFRLHTVIVLVVFLYTKIQLFQIAQNVTRNASGNHKACLNAKLLSCKIISCFETTEDVENHFNKSISLLISLTVRLASFWNRSISVLVVQCLCFRIYIQVIYVLFVCFCTLQCSLQDLCQWFPTCFYKMLHLGNRNKHLCCLCQWFWMDLRLMPHIYVNRILNDFGIFQHVCSIIGSILGFVHGFHS